MSTKLTTEQAEVLARIRKTPRARAAEAVRLAAEGMSLQDAARQAGVQYVTALKVWRQERQGEAPPPRKRSEPAVSKTCTHVHEAVGANRVYCGKPARYWLADFGYDLCGNHRRFWENRGFVVEDRKDPTK